jgi:hypothetical protein
MIRAGRFRIAIKYPAESSIEASAARGTCENKFRKRHAVSVTTPFVVAGDSLFWHDDRIPTSRAIRFPRSASCCSLVGRLRDGRQYLKTTCAWDQVPPKFCVPPLKGKSKLILSMVSRRRAELVVCLGTEDASLLRPQPPRAPRWGRILVGSLLQPTGLQPGDPSQDHRHGLCGPAANPIHLGYALSRASEARHGYPVLVGGSDMAGML